MMLAEGITLDVGWLVGIVTTVTGAAAGGVKILWSYWSKKMEDDRLAMKAILDAKDVLIMTLQKELSKKSDDNAQKIEQLQSTTIMKMEAFNEKVISMVERMVEQAAETAAILRALQVSQGNERRPS